MKILLYTISLILSILFSLNAFASTQSHALDHIVAIVNDDVITQTELDHAVSLLTLQMSQSQANIPPAKELEKKMLEQLINKKLQLQIAKQAGMTIKDSEVDKAVKNIASQNHVTVKELYEHLATEGLSKTEYRDELRNQITLQKLQQSEVASHINISQDELKRFERNKAWKQDLKVENEYQIEDILVPTTDNATTAEIAKAKQRATAILNALKKHQHLTAKEKNGLNTTDLGFKRLNQLPSAFVSKIITLEEDGAAGPIQTGNGFHIIRLASLRPIENTSSETKPTHKQVEQLLFQHKFEEAMKTFISKLRSQAFIVTHPDA